MGLKVLKNKPSEYVRLVAGGETVLVVDRDRVVAELVPPREGRSPLLADAQLAEAVRRGWITAPALPPGSPPPRAPVAPLHDLLGELEQDRSDRRSISIPPWPSHICSRRIGSPRSRSGRSR